jgi:hypothetical protein
MVISQSELVPCEMRTRSNQDWARLSNCSNPFDDYGISSGELAS